MNSPLKKKKKSWFCVIAILRFNLTVGDYPEGYFFPINNNLLLLYNIEHKFITDKNSDVTL